MPTIEGIFALNRLREQTGEGCDFSTAPVRTPSYRHSGSEAPDAFTVQLPSYENEEAPRSMGRAALGPDEDTEVELPPFMD
jgi:hypothetical protein